MSNLYFRFEILLMCLKDINNKQFYPSLDEKIYSNLDVFCERLQKICLYINIALEEYSNMLISIETNLNIEKQI